MVATDSLPDGSDNGPAFGPCECPGSVRGVRLGRLLRGRRLRGLDCDSPLQLVMSCCGWVWHKTCERHACSPCEKRIRRRNARVVDAGMQAQLRDGRRLWLLTLTAPGSKAHGRWTPAQHYVRGAVRPSCSCHVGVDLADWNPSAGACWNRLRTSLARDDRAEFYRAAEVQDGTRSDGGGRGALHHHVVLATRGALEVLEVQALALAAGYGCVIDLQPIEAGADLSDLATYVSKRVAGYVSKSSGENRQQVPWRADVVDQDSGEVLRLHTVPTYRTHSQSAGWGCTVRQVKDHARDQARRRAAKLAQLADLTDAGPGANTPEPVAAAGVEPPP